jgi:hypothetical protein
VSSHSDDKPSPGNELNCKKKEKKEKKEKNERSYKRNSVL